MNDPDPTSETPKASPAKAAGGAARPFVGVVVGLALFAGGIGGFFLGRAHLPAGGETAGPAKDQAARAAERRAVPSLEQQLAARRLAGWRQEPIEPIAPVDGPVTMFQPVLNPAPPYDAVDATLFDSLDARIRLAQALPVGRNETCLDADGTRFACGLRGRASLQNFIFTKTVTCTRLFLGRDERRGVIDARCSVDGQDLALRQIRAGWAFPSEYADAEHRAAFDEARRNRIGVWAGPYSMLPQDQSEIDAREVSFGTLRLPGGTSEPAQPWAKSQ